jgi:ABC-type nitrate/sulfonate/bicarbonate transport system permease component
LGKGGRVVVRLTKISRNLAGIGAVLLVWQALTSAGVINPFLLPPPSLLLATFWEMTLDGSLFAHAGASLDRVVVGFMVAAFVGITLGVALGWWSMASDLLKPIVEALRPIPPIAWTPLAILWFGTQRKPARCQRTTVSGSTIVRASTIRGAIRYKQTKTIRSKLLKTGRFGALRCNTFS